jgi:hypothetical protein
LELDDVAGEVAEGIELRAKRQRCDVLGSLRAARACRRRDAAGVLLQPWLASVREE